MCGIAGIHVKKEGFIKDHEGLETFVNHLLLGIERRGTHSTGFVATTFGSGEGTRKTVMDKAPIAASDFIKSRDKLPDNPQTILLHTRYATKGGPEDHRNNHPVLHKTCFAVHNGHVNNDDELFEKYSMDRFAEVDSEAIPALAYKIGLDDPAEWLSKMEGYIATAVIDPVNFPGRLVLAKGKWSPIVSFENDRFLVWASEIGAIKDAWAAVLGTPPKYNKFHHWKDGELWIYDDSKKEEATFQVPNYVKSYTKTKKEDTPHGAPPVEFSTPIPSYWKERGEAERRKKESPTAGTVVNPSELDDNTKRELVVRAMVRAARNNGDAWLKCPTMNAMTEATRAELREMYPEMGEMLTWNECPCCRTFIVKEQFRKTLNWGTICLDCHEGNLRYYQNKVKHSTDEDEDEGNILWLDDKTNKELSAFLEVENELHFAALVAVSDETDVDVSIIEWLIFRAPDSYFNDRPTLADVAQEFDNMYQEYMEQLWEEKKEEDQKEALLAYCKEHGNYHNKDANCPDCALDAAWQRHAAEESAARDYICPLPPVGGLTIEASLAKPVETVANMKVCVCGNFTLQDKCAMCKEKEAKEATPPVRLALAPGPKPVGEETCVTCGNGAEYVVPRNTWAWCVDHFVECAECTALANHTRPDGVRVCHHHARNQKGVVADKLLKEKYGNFVELGRY